MTPAFSLTDICGGGSCPLCQVHTSTLADLYATSGGLVSVDDLILDMRRRGTVHPLLLLTDWIATRSLIFFSLNARLVFPRVQFEEESGLVLSCVVEVLSELRDVYDDLEVAAWFARENACLGNQSPLDFLSVDEDRLLAVARADRFIARG